MTRKVIMIPISILLAGFLIMVFLISFQEDPPDAKPTPPLKIVDVEVVQLQNVPTKITGYGRLTSTQPVILYSEVNGTLLNGSIPFLPAQSFKKGDLFLKIDDRQIILDLNSTKSDFLNALAAVLPEIKVDFPEEYVVWQTYFNNCSFDKRMETIPETNNQKIKLFLSRFNVYKLYFLVNNLEIQLEKHYFYAPFNGSILTADLRAGSTARVGIRLGEIINLDDMEVEVPISSQDVQWIDRKKSVKFSSSEISGEWSGKIKRIGKNIDTRSQTVQVFISVGNSHKDELLNRVFLKAEIPGNTVDHAYSVPRKAIYEENFVYLIKDGKLDYHEINVARTELESVIVDNGLATGDTLVVEVLQGVAEGMMARAKTSLTN